MSEINLKKVLINIYITFILVTIEFIGLLISNNFMNFENVEAQTIIVDCHGMGNYTKIQEAINYANSGDIIRVWAGTYNENLYIHTSVTLIGNGTENTIIEGNMRDPEIQIRANWVDLTGFNITNNLDSSQIYIDNVENVSINDNVCSNNTIFLNNCVNITILNNRILSGEVIIMGELKHWNSHIIDNNTMDGRQIYYYKNIDGGSIQTKNGLMILANCKNILIKNQNINNNSKILMGFSNKNKFNKNIFDSNNFKIFDYSIQLYNSDSNIFENNTFYNNTRCLKLSSSNFNTIINNKFSNNINSPFNHGIYIDGSNFNIIENNNLSEYGGNVFLWSSISNIIKNNDFSNTNGIGLHYCNNNTIIDNICLKSGIGGYGDFNTIMNNIVNFGGGISVIGDFNTVRKNICNSNLHGGISIHGDSNIAKNNICNYNLESGILVWGESSNTIDNNNCNSNNRHGIYLKSWTNPDNFKSNIIINNNCSLNNDSGIYLEASIENYIIHNTCNLNNNSGIYLNSSNFNIINNNTCNFNINNGLISLDATSNEIHNNTFNSNKENGIWIDTTDLNKEELNTIEFNNISNNKNGIYLESDSNTVTKNTISNNHNIGLLMDYHSNYNYIFYNYIISNSQQAIDNGFNWWDNEKSEGNYWSDWTIPDLNNDGIVDYPYNISGIAGTKDHFPLTKRYVSFPNLPPRINYLIESLEILEDTPVSGLINLYDWFFDPDDNKLIFSVEGESNISVEINSNNGTVKFSPKKDWNGNENLIFTANDTISEIKDNVLITVLGVNDPPEMPKIIEPSDKALFDISSKINFSGNCSDVDEIYGDKLNFTWKSNISGVLGFGTELKNISLPIGNHNISLIVFDLMNVSNSTNITVLIKDLDSDNDGYNDTIEKLFGTNPYNNTSFPKDFDHDLIPDRFDDDNDTINDTIPDNDEKNDKDKKSKDTNYIFYLVISIVIIIFLILLTLFMRHKKRIGKNNKPRPRKASRGRPRPKVKVVPKGQTK